MKTTLENNTGIEGKVIAIIADKLGIEESEITPQSSFMNDLGADSMDVIELVMEFENKFSITISDSEAEKISTVAEAVERIKEKVEQKELAYAG